MNSLAVGSALTLPTLQVTEGEPSVMWLSGLHIPESYLTALVQATCRRNGWPLDRSTLFTQVTKFQDADEVSERAGQGTVSPRGPTASGVGSPWEPPRFRGRTSCEPDGLGQVCRSLCSHMAASVHCPCLDISRGSTYSLRRRLLGDRVALGGGLDRAHRWCAEAGSWVRVGSVLVWTTGRLPWTPT